MTPNPVEGRRVHPALHTRFCDLVGVRYPIVQTGMGWVAGPRLVAATAEAGGLGILASATMTFDELVSAIGEVRSRTDRPFGVNMRTDVADVGDRVALMIEHGVRVASFAQAPKPELVTRCREAGLVVMPTIGARRHAEKVAELGGRRGDRPGRRGRRPYRIGPHHAAHPGRRGCGRGPGRGDRRWWLLRRPGPGGGPGLRRVGHRHGHPVPPHPGEPGTRRGQAGISRDTGHRHGGLHRRRRRPAASHPNRTGRQARTVELAAEPAQGPGQRARLPSRDRTPHYPPWSRKGAP